MRSASEDIDRESTERKKRWGGQTDRQGVGLCERRVIERAQRGRRDGDRQTDGVGSA